MTQDNPSNAAAKVAVAISHDGKAEGQPQIAASGRGALAEQILQLAFENGVRVRQDSDLAEILATLDIDSAIPSEAIIAVAEILTRVYAANQELDKSPPNPPDSKTDS